MKPRLLHHTIVISASENNPSILHPSFLSSEKIIPEDWELDGDPFSSQAVSVVRYKPGIVFMVEAEKFQIADNKPSAQILDSKIPGIASKYVAALPKVRYTGVGINFAFATRHDNPSHAVQKAIVSSGPWREPGLSLESAKVELQFAIKDVKLSMKINPGTVKIQNPKEEYLGIGYHLNYHVSISGDGGVDAVQEAIKKYPERVGHAMELAPRFSAHI